MNSAKPPTPAEVEEHAKEYDEYTSRIEEIAIDAENKIEPLRKRAEELKAWFVENVQEFGSAHAEKSKLLHGIEMEAMVTIGQSASIDAAAVETFRLALKKAEKSSVINRIFDRTVRWILLPGASAFIRENQAKLGSKLVALYAQCTVTKDKAPQLTVRPKQKAA